MVRMRIISGPAALALLALTLVVFYLGGWYLYEVTRRLAEREMDRKLEAIAQMATLRLEELPIIVDSEPGWVADLFQSLGPESPSVMAARRFLVQLARDNDLRDVHLLDARQVVLLTSDAGTTEGQRTSLPDAVFFEETLASGIVRSSPYYDYQGSEYKHCLAPTRNGDGAIVAVLRVSSGPSYFEELANLRTYLVAIALIGSALLTLVAAAFHRLLVAAARTEQAMADADRLQSLGALAAGMAHEIRNPLGIIRAIAEELRETCPHCPDDHALLTDITGEVERLNALVTQFLSFARPGEAGMAGTAPQPFALDKTLAEVIQLVRKGSESAGVVFDLEHADAPPPLAMEEKSIRQVLLNVLLNARDAVGKRGLVRARLDVTGDWARIRIQDDGPGMDPRHLRRAFDPFFSTKPTGTGLGLSISRSIVERYGGRLTIDSAPGKGATVTILLPGAKRK